MPSVKEEENSLRHTFNDAKHPYNKSFVLPVIKMIYTAE